MHIATNDVKSRGTHGHETHTAMPSLVATTHSSCTSVMFANPRPVIVSNTSNHTRIILTDLETMFRSDMDLPMDLL